MRVPGSQVGSVETRTGEVPVRRPGNESTESATAAGPAAGDAVVVGGRSQEVQAQSARAGAARSEKLERIAAALADGSYQVDFTKVAEKLVDDELARGGQS